MDWKTRVAQEVRIMKHSGKAMLLLMVVLVFAALVLAAPGVSRAGGWDEPDHGTYYTGDQSGQGLEIQQVKHWKRRPSHRVWVGYGGPYYGYYYYGPRYYGPAVTYGFPYAYPYPYVAPGVSVHIGL